MTETTTTSPESPPETERPGTPAAVTKKKPRSVEGDVTIRAALREFATADPRSLGLFRIVFGIFLLVDLYRRIPDYILFYTNEGMLPNHGSIYRPMSTWLFSIYHAFSSRTEVAVAFALTGVVYILYMVGWRTKIWQIATLVCVTSLHSRNIMLENGGDVVANLLALWTCFLPLGRRFSVDAMQISLRSRKEANADELNDRSAPLAPTAPIVALAFACQILNVALIYYFNTIHKDGYTWRQGVSVHFVFWADRLVQPMGVWMRGWVPLLLIKVMTIGTLVMESTIALLLVSPIWTRACRRVAALLIIALHSGFQVAGHFGLFSFVMMLHSILLLGAEDWDALARRMRERLPSRLVFYEATCGVCHQLVRIAKRLDHLGKLTFLANDDVEALPAGVSGAVTSTSVVVTDPAKKHVWTRGAALTQGLRALPYGVGLARVLELPGLFALTNAAYDAVATRRERISMAMGYAACGVPQTFGGPVLDDPSRPRPPLFGKWVPRLREAVTLVFAVALGSQVILENRKVPQLLKDKLTPQPVMLAQIAQYPRFFQGWSMFAPIPPMDDGKIVVDGITADGRHIDPLTNGKPVDFELPGVDEGMLMTQFWYEFHDRLRRDQNARYRDHLRDYLLAWHTIEGRPAKDRIVSFEAYWVWRNTQPPNQRRREATQRQRFMQWGGTETAAPAPATPLAPRPDVPIVAPPGMSNRPPLRTPIGGIQSTTGH